MSTVAAGVVPRTPEEGAAAPDAPPRRVPAVDRLLVAATALMAIASVLGLRLAVAAMPGGAARLQLLLWTGVVAALLAVLAGVLRPMTRAIRNGVAALPAGPVAWGAVAVLVGAVVATHVLEFRGMPQFPDTFSELFQARILASGRLWLPAPPDVAAVGIANVVDHAGRWYAQYPVGNPALLALGLRMGASWLPAALVAVALALGTRALALEVAGPAAAATSVVLLVVSPMIVLSTAAVMSQATTAALAACVLALVLRARRSLRVGAAAAAGLLTGLAATVRPLDAALLGLVSLVALGTAGGRRRAAVLSFGASAAVGALPMLLVNALTTGSPLRFGYEVLWGAGTLPGFGLRGRGVYFGPVDAMHNTLSDLAGLDLALLEWPVPVLPALAAVVAAKVKPLPAGVRLLLSYALLHVAVYATYWHHDFFFGPRFLLPIVPALVVLLAAGLVRLARWRPAGRSLVARAGVAGRRFLFAQAAVAGLLVALPRLAHSASEDVAAARAVTLGARAAGLSSAVVRVDDGWGARLVSRMWRLGVPVPAAERFYAEADACTLEQAVDRVEAGGAGQGTASASLAVLLEGATPGIPLGHPPSAHIRLQPGAPLAPACEAELRYDEDRFRAPFAPLLWLNSPDGAGVRFERDPGPGRGLAIPPGSPPVYRVRVDRDRAGYVVAFEPVPAGPARRVRVP